MDITTAQTRIMEHKKLLNAKSQVDQAIEVAASGGTVSFEIRVVAVDGTGRSNSVQCPITLNADEAAALLTSEQRDISANMAAIESLFQPISEGI